MIYVGIYYVIGLLISVLVEGRRVSSASFVVAAIWPIPFILALYHTIKWNLSCK